MQNQISQVRKNDHSPLRGQDDRRIRDSHIIKLYHEGITPVQLAERFNLSNSQIFYILRQYRSRSKSKNKIRS